MVASASWKDGELSANLRPPFDLIRTLWSTWIVPRPPEALAFLSNVAFSGLSQQQIVTEPGPDGKSRVCDNPAHATQQAGHGEALRSAAVMASTMKRP